jgi:hypothetical protein
MSCKDKEKFTTAEASTKASLRTKGAIDTYRKILDINLFNKLNREWSENAQKRFNVKGRLFYNEEGIAIPNKVIFKAIDRSKGVVYLQKNTPENLFKQVYEIPSETAFEEANKMDIYGITSNQASKIPLINSLIYRAILPATYLAKQLLKKAPINLVIGRTFDSFKKELKSVFDERDQDAQSRIIERVDSMSEQQYNNREDAWRLSNGLSQKHNTFVYVGRNEQGEDVYDFTNPAFDLKAANPLSGNDTKNYVMGNYAVKVGKDDIGYYVQYSDRWDLEVVNPLIQKIIDLTQKPFVVTGKIYRATTVDEFGDFVNYYTYDTTNPDIQITKQLTAELDTFEKKEEVKVAKESNTISSTASPETLSAIKNFIKAIGVDLKVMQEMIINGVKYDANGAALIMQNLIQVVEGKENVALSEEAMHFAVEIIKQTNPALYKKLMSEINNYKIKDMVWAEYANDPNYQINGKPDVIKLKEEAIAKLLVETIINKNEGTTEKPELLSMVENTWYDKIISWIKSLFVKSGFDQAAMQIITGENIGTVEDIRSKSDNLFLQATVSVQDSIINKLQEISSTIVNTGDGYTINNRKIANRVSDLVSAWYERKFRNNDINKTAYQTVVDDLKAEKGTAGHSDLEEAQKLFINPDGTLKSYNEREDAKRNDSHISNLNANDNSMYLILRDNMEKRLLSFPVGTKFLAEQKIYDEKRDLAGTVDFLAITLEGKISILDWKFMDLNTDKHTDIPWYKIGAWNIQMNQYKYILGKVYGVKIQDFDQTRMIPIKAYYTKGNAKTGILPALSSIDIGDVNVKNIVDDYLLPVGIESEKTGIKKVDALLIKLNAIYKKLSEQKALPSEKISKSESLNALFSAIRQLQMKQNIEPLVYQSKVLNKQIAGVLQTYKDKYENKDAHSFTAEEISQFAETIATAKDALSIYTTLDLELNGLLAGSTNQTDLDLIEDIRSTSDVARELQVELKELDEKFTVEIIGGSENVEGLSSPEKIVRGLSKWFGNTATIQMKSMEVLFKKANKAFGYAGMDTMTEIQKLQSLRNSYMTWVSGKNLKLKDQFNILKKSGKNELIDEFNPEFYKILKEKQNKDSRDFDWIRDNVDVDAYRDFLEEKKKVEIQRVEDSRATRVGSIAQINYEIGQALSKIESMYSITGKDSSGWLLYDLISKFPKRSTWETTEWKELNKLANKPALDFYNYIIERNSYYRDIGYIHGAQARTFLPWVRKGLAEKLVFGGKISIGEQFLINISIDEGDTGYGKVDPFTGKIVNTVPIYLTSEIEGEYSDDLFKTMGMYNEFAIKFKYLTEIEAQAKALLRLEQNKEAIATSYFGKTEYEYGMIKNVPDNSENTKLYEDMMKAIIYQQKFIESETFDQILGTLGKTGEKINSKLGFKLLPEGMENKQISVNKLIDQLNQTFQVSTLGLNILSATSNLFGGKSQALINSGKYYTKADFVKTELWLLANKMGGEDKQKQLAALHYFLPFTENMNRELIDNLSINALTKEGLQDYLMILMRKSDHAVQMTNFFAYLNNSIVVGDKVLNTREYLRTFPEYQDMYAGTQAERTSRKNAFEKEVIKLNETQGVIKASVLVDGVFTIPGVEQKSQSIIELRRKVQQISSDALGSMTAENKRLMNLNIYGNSFMVFKNWIPRLVDVRLGNLKYNAASDAYEWGRSRMMYRVITTDMLGAIGNIRNSIIANDKGIAYLKDLYEKKKSDYTLDTGKDLNMTETEFMDLVRQNMKNQLLDLLFYASLFAMFALLNANAPDDDEKDTAKNQWKFVLKATDKLKDEIGYFYNPMNLTQLLKGGFPMVSLLNNYEKFIVNFGKEMYGIAFENEEYVEKNNVIKYLMKSFPVSNQALSLLPMFSPELAKDLGVKMQGQYGVK